MIMGGTSFHTYEGRKTSWEKTHAPPKKNEERGREKQETSRTWRSAWEILGTNGHLVSCADLAVSSAILAFALIRAAADVSLASSASARPADASWDEGAGGCKAHTTKQVRAATLIWDFSVRNSGHTPRGPVARNFSFFHALLIFS